MAATGLSKTVSDIYRLQDIDMKMFAPDICESCGAALAMRLVHMLTIQ